MLYRWFTSKQEHFARQYILLYIPNTNKALCREYKLTMQYTVDGHFMTVEGKVNGGKEDAVGRN